MSEYKGRPEINWIVHSRRLTDVSRCGVLPVVKKQSVAEHTYNAQIIAMEICRRLVQEGYVDKDSLSALVGGSLCKTLFHDLEETIIGDIPYPVKNFNPVLKNIINEAQNSIMKKFYPADICVLNSQAKEEICGQIVSKADYLELAVYCLEEQTLGNGYGWTKEVFEECVTIGSKDDGTEFGIALSKICKDMIESFKIFYKAGAHYDTNARIKSSS